jgi:hypothetical protein
MRLAAINNGARAREKKQKNGKSCYQIAELYLKATSRNPLFRVLLSPPLSSFLEGRNFRVSPFFLFFFVTSHFVRVK